MTCDLCDGNNFAVMLADLLAPIIVQAKSFDVEEFVVHCKNCGRKFVIPKSVWKESLRK